MKPLLTLLLILTALTLLVSAPAFTQDDWLPLPEHEITRIAFGSCAKQWEPQPIWNTVAVVEPDLFLFVGDAIYGDWHGDQPFVPTRESLQADWDRLAAIPEFAAVRKQVPFMATWDNHDYGSHDGGAEFSLKETSKSVFLDFFGESDNSPRRQTPGIYDARILGPEGRRVQVILLDTRFFRSDFRRDSRSPEERKTIGKVGKYSPNDDKSATLLGEAQWQWLELQLKQPAELRLIVSSIQIVANEKGMGEWGAFPRERQRLFDLIESTHANGVLLLSGNVHFTEVSKYEGGRYPLYDFTASGMTHVTPAYASAPNAYRVAGPFVEHNVGLTEIDWEAPDPVVRLRALGVDGRDGFKYELSLGELK